MGAWGGLSQLVWFAPGAHLDSMATGLGLRRLLQRGLELAASSGRSPPRNRVGRKARLAG